MIVWKREDDESNNQYFEAGKEVAAREIDRQAWDALVYSVLTKYARDIDEEPDKIITLVLLNRQIYEAIQMGIELGIGLAIMKELK